MRLKASAPSIHMMAANITTEVSPIVGSEKQSEELVMYLLREFEENPKKIWESNIFGKSLHELVNEGLHNKLYRMPGDARMKLQETIERIINEGCTGLICIISVPYTHLDVYKRQLSQPTVRRCSRSRESTAMRLPRRRLLLRAMSAEA